MRTLSLALFLLFPTILLGQSARNYGDNPEIAKAKFQNLSSLVKDREFKSAIPDLDWLIENAPDLSKALYINGAKIYYELAKIEDDASTREAYWRKMLVQYDLMIEKYENTQRNYVERAMRSRTIMGNIKSVYPELIEINNAAYDAVGSDIIATIPFYSYLYATQHYGVASPESCLQMAKLLSVLSIHKDSTDQRVKNRYLQIAREIFDESNPHKAIMDKCSEGK